MYSPLILGAGRLERRLPQIRRARFLSTHHDLCRFFSNYLRSREKCSPVLSMGSGVPLFPLLNLEKRFG